MRRQIVDLGGSIGIAAQDTPYKRLATAADPTGTLIAPHEPIPANTSSN